MLSHIPLYILYTLYTSSFNQYIRVYGVYSMTRVNMGKQDFEGY